MDSNTDLTHITVVGTKTVNFAASKTYGASLVGWAATIATGFTLTINAQYVSGVTVTGDGSITINAMDSDTVLTHINVVGTKTANFAASKEYGASLNGWTTTIEGTYTLTIDAQYVSGVTVNGGGSIIVNAMDSNTDLTHINVVGTKTANFAASKEYGASLNGWTTTIATASTLSILASYVSGVTVTGLGSVTVNSLDSSPESSLVNITASGLVQILIDSDVEFSGTYPNTASTLGGGYVHTVTNNSAFTSDKTYTIAIGTTLSAAASVVTGKAIVGEGSVTVNAVDSDTDLTTIVVSGTKTANFAASKTYGASLNGWATNVASDSTLTISAARINGVTVSGDGNVLVTSLDATADADLSYIVPTGTVTIDVPDDVRYTGLLNSADKAKIFNITADKTLTIPVTSGNSNLSLKNNTYNGGNLIISIESNSSLNLSGLLGNASKSIEFAATTTFSGTGAALSNTDADENAVDISVGSGFTLNSTAPILDGKTITGLGNVTISGLINATLGDFSNIEVATCVYSITANITDFRYTIKNNSTNVQLNVASSRTCTFTTTYATNILSVHGAADISSKLISKTGSGSLVFAAASPLNARRVTTITSPLASQYYAFTDTQLNTINSYTVGTKYVIYYTNTPVTTNAQP